MLHDGRREPGGDRVNGMDAAQSFQLVHVRPETITHTVVPVVEATPVDTFSRNGSPGWRS